MVKNELPNEYFTIISDKAYCFEKAHKDSFGDKFSLIYCLFHLKKNFFFKKFNLKPTTSLWKCLKN